ncbi:MAG: hypothetical protein M9894_39315 [Planctomycetes bacterium]|nr:hypothetical protein [Planctomycetota bacterium]
MAARKLVKLTPKAPPSAELVRLAAKEQQLARESTAVRHLRAIEEAQQLRLPRPLSRRRLGTLTKAIFVVGVAEDGGPTIEGERVRLDAGHRDKVGRRRGARKVGGLAGYAQGIFDLADYGETWLDEWDKKKLNVILKRWKLRVEWRDPEKEDVFVLRWHHEASSDLTPVFRRDQPQTLNANQLRAVRQVTASAKKARGARPKGRKSGEWRGVRWEALLQAPDSDPGRIEATSGQEKSSRGHKKTRARTSSTQPPAKTRRRGAKP